MEDLIRQLLEAGVHFGHQTNRWNPKMSKYIFGERSGVYIIDLEKTLGCLEQARNFLKELARQGGKVLFVGTKRQAQDIIQQEAGRCGMFYVTNRWLGGLLTNFSTIKKSIIRLKELEELRSEGGFLKLSKKEAARLNKELEKLQRTLSGVAGMDSLPDAIFVIDSKKEQNAIKEANKLSIPVVSLVDTNCDPERINYPIPGNDDAIKSIRLVSSLITESIIESGGGLQEEPPQPKVEEVVVEEEKGKSKTKESEGSKK